MKKFTFLLAFVAVAMFANAGQWVETFGADDVVKNAAGYWPYVSGTGDNYVYTAYDHAADCVYSGFSASVRKVNPSATTAGMGNHVWLAAPKPANPPQYPNPSDSWLSISGIEAAGATELTFDFAGNVDNYTPNIKVWVNNVEVSVPTVSAPATNTPVSIGTITVAAAASAYEIKFQNFDAAQGIRIDNVTFKGTTPIKHVTIDNSVYANNGRVYAAGEFQIFSVAGQNVTELNGNLNGIYIVKTATGIQKVAVK